MQKHKIHIIFPIKSLLSSNLSLVDANSHASNVLLPSKTAAFSFWAAFSWQVCMWPIKTLTSSTSQTEHIFVFHQRVLFAIDPAGSQDSDSFFAQITTGGGAKCSLYRRKHRVQVNERCSWSRMRETPTKSLTSGKKPLFHHTVVLFTAFCFYWIFKPDSLIYPGLKEKTDLRAFFLNFLYVLIVLDNNVFVCFLAYYLTVTIICIISCFF